MEGASGIPVRTDFQYTSNRATMLTKRSGFDRDLSIAGRVMVKTNNDTFEQRLVKVDRPSQFFPLNTSSRL